MRQKWRSTCLLALISISCTETRTDDPELHSVEPATVSDQATIVMVQADNLWVKPHIDLDESSPLSVDSSFSLSIDGVEHSDFSVLDHQNVELHLPAGLDQGSHSLALTIPDGRTATLTDAFSVMDWWQPGFGRRAQITVKTGANLPHKGYAGYTVQVALDSAAMVEAGALQPDCDDLRVTFWDGDLWHELAHHLVDCNSDTSSLRFALQHDMAANGTDDRYFLYYDNAAASAPAALTPTEVYLWHDDASSDRLASYQTGRLDTWVDVNTLVQDATWNASGYYDFTTGGDSVSSFRRAVEERDVYIETELFHTDCYTDNMATGLVTRGIIASGMGMDENADHYYLTQRGHQAECGDGYDFDGDVIKTGRPAAVIDGPNPAALPRSQWRKQALATHGTNPTNITFWDNDLSWPSLGWPRSSVHVSGTDSDDYEGAGFAGLWIAQDGGRFRGMLIRRYVEPEPAMAIGVESVR